MARARSPEYPAIGLKGPSSGSRCLGYRLIPKSQRFLGGAYRAQLRQRHHRWHGSKQPQAKESRLIRKPAAMAGIFLHQRNGPSEGQMKRGRVARRPLYRKFENCFGMKSSPGKSKVSAQ